LSYKSLPVFLTNTDLKATEKWKENKNGIEKIAAEEPGEHFLFLCFTAFQLFSRRHET
jgi:hypothetical protein